MNNLRIKMSDILSDFDLLFIIKKLTKYCISGGTGALIDFGVYSFLIYFFSANYLFSNLVSFTCGTLATYYLQKNWTFRYKANKRFSAFKRYILAVIGTYILNTLLLFIFIDLLVINVFIAKVLQILLSTIWGYSVNSIYVFKK
ncbi:putative flippase GtrA [Methanomicrobium sp. W14]|uniref:GtrA family protein n=1 Tax=Methanomicrobium sp. W14 TaxID=2817839 RepID=UPI001AE6C834|nr:GtrA family protein [Methanomicrobium sp. W14]MBP2134448.1 putative flippase GtrA [Methanomicrobium sp. W14]